MKQSGNGSKTMVNATKDTTAMSDIYYADYYEACSKRLSSNWDEIVSYCRNYDSNKRSTKTK